MTDKFEALLREVARRTAAAKTPNILESCFPQQLAFIKDPAKKKTLFCTRRAAKSFTAGIYLIYEALTRPGCNCLFLGLTRETAKNIIWKDILQVIDEKYDLQAEFNKSDLSMTFPNGSVIKIMGMDADESEMRKVLGGKYRLVCLDEASMFTVNVHSLVYGYIDPATADDDGTICLMGTASNFPRGLFFDITNRTLQDGKLKEPGWSNHTWTAYDNPHVVKQWHKKMEEIRTQRPLYMETPQYKQWYLNEWKVDETKLVYRFHIDRNLTKTFPTLHKDGWSYVLGIDTGWEDDNAFVLTAYHVSDPTCYVVRIFHKNKMTFDEVVNMTGNFLKDPMTGEHLPCRVVIDGSAKQGVESMRQRSHIPFEFADKQDKASFIEMLNADLIQGKVKIVDTPANRALWEEMSNLVWMTDGDTIRTPKKENPSISNHLCDALLYSWRMGFHYQAVPAELSIPKGSNLWFKQQSENIWEREREHLDRELQGDGSDFPDSFKW